MITVYRAGVFTRESDPTWLIHARDKARKRSICFQDALSGHLDNAGIDTWIARDRVEDAHVASWELSQGSRYVELYASHERVEAVLIPEPEDWLPFYTTFAVPFLQAHAGVATAQRLHRIANLLAAWTRHGEGTHIDRFSGLSSRDQATTFGRPAP